MNWAANIWGRFAAANHNTGPVNKESNPMTTVTKLAPVAQPDHATIQWLKDSIKRGERGIHTARVLVNPGVAANLLERNPDNRGISPTKAEHYATDMASGRWADNGETIIVSSCGLLNDGQHRMQAVIDSNSVLPFTFVFGVPRETRLTVDQGFARTAGNYLAMANVKYSSESATAAKWIIGYERSGGKGISQRSKVTNGEVIQRVRSDDDIIASAAYSVHYYPITRNMFSKTVMTVAHYILSEIHPSEAKAFLDTVALGENIKRGDPAFAVRQAFMSEKRDRQEALEIIFHGWNAYRQNRPLKLAKSYGTLPALV